MKKKDKTYTKENISQLLESNPKAVMKAIVVLYDRQTETEKQTSTTCESNNIGFNAFDAGVMSCLANKIIKHKGLNKSDMEIAKKRVMKYAGQLADIANERLKYTINPGTTRF